MADQTDIGALFSALDPHQKLALVRRLLNDVEHELKLADNTKTVRQLPLLDGMDDIKDDWAEFDPAQLSRAGHDAQEERIHAGRLRDAAEYYHKLLRKHGYLRSKPSLRDLAKAALEQESARAEAARPRPEWHDWVTKADEEAEQARVDAEAKAREESIKPENIGVLDEAKPLTKLEENHSSRKNNNKPAAH